MRLNGIHTKRLFLIGIIGLFVISIGLFTDSEPATADNKAIATVDGVTISEAEIEKSARRRMMKILSQAYEIKRGLIENRIDEILLEKEAKKRGITVYKLTEQEVRNKTKEPTEAELKTIFEIQKNRRYRGKSFEDVQAQLKRLVQKQKEQSVYKSFVDKLRKNVKISVMLERPSVEVSVDDDPGIGNPKAPIKLIEFSEFQCPFCKKARPTIKKVLSTYGDQVYYVFRDFPLSFHKNATSAAVAANCAGVQGKYWDFSDLLWNHQRSLGKAKYDEIAKQLNLDMAKFENCTTNSEAQEKEIYKDQADGSQVGVTGTPAYFINGKFLSGAQPYAKFKEIIDEELAKIKK